MQKRLSDIYGSLDESFLGRMKAKPLSSFSFKDLYMLHKPVSPTVCGLKTGQSHIGILKLKNSGNHPLSLKSVALVLDKIRKPASFHISFEKLSQAGSEKTLKLKSREEKEHRNPVYWRLASFMLLTGARVGEACGMKWSAVDLENGIARVIRRIRWDHFTRKPFLEEVTKTSQSARLLVLPKRLQDILLEMKRTAMNDLVFTDTKGELLRYNAVQSAFNAGFTALKLPWRSTHICRHTYATMALMGTKNLSAVQATLGHTEQRVTQRYAKAVALLSSDIGEKTSSVLFGTAK